MGCNCTACLFGTTQLTYLHQSRLTTIFRGLRCNRNTLDSIAATPEVCCCTSPSKCNPDCCGGMPPPGTLPGRSGTKLGESRSMFCLNLAQTVLECHPHNRSTQDSTSWTPEVCCCTNPSMCSHVCCRGKRHPGSLPERTDTKPGECRSSCHCGGWAWWAALGRPPRSRSTQDSSPWNLEVCCCTSLSTHNQDCFRGMRPPGNLPE